MSVWLNILRNFAKPSYGPVMARKLLKRMEPDTRKQANEWAKTRAISIEEFCKPLDPALWEETTQVCANMRVDCESRLREIGVELGGGGAYPLIYFLIRRLRPRVIVETGVSAGWSSRASLLALQQNGEGGRLYSSDFPLFRFNSPEKYVGCLVPDGLRATWSLDIRGDKHALPEILAKVNSVDLFHYDSDKSLSGRRFALDLVSKKLAPNAVLLMDDIQDNLYFYNYVEMQCMPFTIFEFETKYIGAIGLCHSPSSESGA